MKATNLSSAQTIRKVLGYIKRYWFLLALSIFFAAVTVILTLYAPILIGYGVDKIVGKGNVDFDGLKGIMLQISVVVALTAAAQWIMNTCNNRITFQVVKDIRDKAFRKLERMPLKYIDQHQHGDLVSRIIADVDQFSDGLLMGFTQFFTGVMTILGTLVFMLVIDYKIALVVVLITPVSLFVANFIAKKTFSMFRLQSQTRGEITSLIDEMIGNQKVVKAFGYEDDAMERLNEINGRLQSCSLRATFFSSITNPSTRFVNSLVYTAVALVGALSVMSGSLSVGLLTSFLNYANQYTKPFNEISGVVTELQNALASASRVFELIEEPSETPDAEHATVLEEVDGSVTLDQVYFSYRQDRPLIENLNLLVRPGQRVAIVG
ncbi:MAG: ABC transporter ATP-binding protein, partial [Clostridiales bacterium]|nr:ABC transporter ATP-binding protein [Clostridiales bacterium]